jgi:hypothetical protein
VLGSAIRQGIAEGAFRPVDPRDTALFISTFLDGSLFRNVMFPTFNYARSIKTMRRIVLDYLKTGVVGTDPDPGLAGAGVTAPVHPSE